MTSTGRVVSVEDVSYSYESDVGSSVLALDRISFTIGRGEFVGLVGRNGSGKTTLARHLNGLLKPGIGRVLVDGQNTRDVETGDLAGTVGYVFQNPDHALFLPSVHEEIAYSLNFQDLDPTARENRIRSALEAFGLTDLEGRHPASFGRGTRRLVVLTAAYAMEPDLLVLDEPTGGLDHRLTESLMATLHGYVDSGRSVLMISHNMQLIASACQRVLMLSQGRLVADCMPAELFADDAELRAGGLQIPEVAALSQRLKDVGFSANTISIDRFVDQFLELAKSSPVRNPT